MSVSSSLPTLTGKIPEEAERAIRQVAAAVDTMEAKVATLQPGAANPMVARLAADLATLQATVNDLSRRVRILEA